MLNFIISTILLCGSLGITISKFSKEPVVRKPRQHTEPLSLN